MTYLGGGATTRKERERERHRNEILTAAERVFGREGYSGATVEAIAQEADFSVGTLYNFFKGKDELYDIVMERIGIVFLKRFKAEVSSQDKIEDAIAALVELRMDHYVAYRGVIRRFFDTSAGSGIDPRSAIREKYRGQYDRYVDGLASLFKQAVDAGRLKPSDPLDLALYLEGVMNAFVSYYSHRESALQVRKRLHEAAKGFLMCMYSDATKEAIKRGEN